MIRRILTYVIGLALIAAAFPAGIILEIGVNGCCGSTPNNYPGIGYVLMATLAVAGVILCVLALRSSGRRFTTRVLVATAICILIAAGVFTVLHKQGTDRAAARNRAEQLQTASKLNNKIYGFTYLPPNLASLQQKNYLSDTKKDSGPNETGLDTAVPESIELVYEFNKDKSIGNLPVVQINQFNKSILAPGDTGCGLYDLTFTRMYTTGPCQQIGKNPLGSGIYKAQDKGRSSIYLTDMGSTRIAYFYPGLDGHPNSSSDSEIVKLFQSLRETSPENLSYY